METLVGGIDTLIHPYVNIPQHELKIVGAAFLFHFVTYMCIRVLTTTTAKSRSYIITFTTSIFLSTVGAYFSRLYWNHFFDGKQIHELESFVFSDHEVARYLTLFFQVSLFLDIAVGLIDYRDQIQLLSGYFHHIFYIAFISWILKNQCTIAFTIMLILELPTFVFSLGNINSNWRQDKLFGLTFCLTRILYHGVMLHQYYQFSWTLWPVITLLWALHWHWFINWCSSQFFRGKKEIKKEQSNESVKQQTTNVNTERQQKRNELSMEHQHKTD